MEDRDIKTRAQLKAQYSSREAALHGRLASLRGRSRGFVVGEIASIAGTVALTALATMSDGAAAKTTWGILAAAAFGLYVVIRNLDSRNSSLMADAERLRKACAREEAYLDGDLSAFDDGQRYSDPHHPFTLDLDIFGPGGLYQRVDRTATTGGADRLAACLSSVDTHKTIAEINACREAIAELAEADRMGFIACGVDGKTDTGALLRSLPHLMEIAIPGSLGGKGIKATGWLLASGLLASIAAAVYGLVNAMLPITWLFANFFLTQWLAGRPLKEMLAACGQLHGQMEPLMRLVARAETMASGTGEQGFRAAPLREAMARLEEARSSFWRLTDIVETLVLRGHGAYKFFSDAFGLRGLFLVGKFLRWRGTAAGRLPEWVAAVAQLDALVSMAQFKSLIPGQETEGGIVRGEARDGAVTVTDSGGVVFEARGLYHPFLGEKAVRNDFTVSDRNFYIITGANMAGKSTFLRAVGVNYILAMNGMPVFAESLTVSRFRLFTSMRTSDDLAHGISYFNAELLRLKELLMSLDDDGSHHQQAHGPLPMPESSGVKGKARHRQTLIILDEILKGTNSLDKLNGSRMFLRAMEDKPVTGIIATHDLELSRMDEESPRFHNFCFEIEIGTNVTYSYKITPGVARNQNATFLLRKLLDSPPSEA